ncbi:MAG: hypothetical protein Q4B69_00125 [Slackia sp.]|nr:hypothetical protein [Slackia sp.]
MRMNIGNKEWWQSLKAPLVAVLAVIAAVFLFIIWLGMVVIATKALIG